MIVKLVLFFIFLVLFESYLRKNREDSIFRPTNSIKIFVKHGTIFATWLGDKFAKLSDIYNIISDIIKYIYDNITLFMYNFIKYIYNNIIYFIKYIYYNILLKIPIEDLKNIILSLYSVIKIPIAFIDGYVSYYNISRGDILLGLMGSISIILIIYHLSILTNNQNNNQLKYYFQK